MKAVNARIEGKVQGVWFRDWTVETARKLGLDGWVRNRSDGSVEAVFAGDDSVVDAMLNHCQEGPELAQVVHIALTPCDKPEISGFTKLPTV
ncbi:MAG: acylphosphatase [Alphaproteobacteria bacterium]|nr:acylphosphatase [Alphaproteobacteria bacterium]